MPRDASEEHLAQTAVAVAAGHQEAGAILRGFLQQSIANAARTGINDPLGRSDAAERQVGF
jgi:hypothetical protein